MSRLGVPRSAARRLASLAVLGFALALPAASAFGVGLSDPSVATPAVGPAAIAGRTTGAVTAAITDPDGVASAEVSADGGVTWFPMAPAASGYGGTSVTATATVNAPATALGIGGLHSCIVLGDGSVRCWGRNANGEIGDGTKTTRVVPTTVRGVAAVGDLTGATAVASGTYHSCAIVTGGSVVCWGEGGYGKLGNGLKVDQTTAVTVIGITDATAISLGGAHSCALVTGGAVKCWGWNTYRQVSSDGVDKTTATTVSGISGAVAISAGGNSTCALFPAGSVKCWGQNNTAQLGTASVSPYYSATPVTVPDISTATSIAVGDGQACALLANARVKCWGDNTYGQLGAGSLSPGTSATPLAVADISTATHVAAGWSHFCARLSTGVVRCWGYNLFGQVGDGTNTTPSLSLSTVADATTASSIAAGGNMSCAFDPGGTLRCWGFNSSTGSLGDGTTVNRYGPVKVRGLIGGLAVGSRSICVRATDANGNTSDGAACVGLLVTDVPGAPTGVSATSGDASATVSWSAPEASGGIEITAYTVTSSPGAKTCTTGGARSCTVVDLTNGTAYTFTVTAANAVGRGSPSAPSGSITPRGVPGAPTGVTGVPTNGAVAVSWSAPGSNGGATITSYRATTSDGSRTCDWTSGTLTCNVSGLTNGVGYTFTVTATNVVGTGPASAASALVTPAPIAPGAPTGVSASAGDTQATVTWVAPDATGGLEITSYTATSNPEARTCTWTSGPLTCTVTGLTNGSPYTFRVRAANGAGTSALSSASVAVTPRTVPGAPTGVYGTPTNGGVIVDWSAPGSNGGAPITSYRATASDGSYCTWTYGPLHCTVAGLTNGRGYTFTVTATNGAGTGAASIPSTVVIPATTPGAPQGASATAGNTTALVTWSPPTDDGGREVTGYTVVSYPARPNCDTTGTTCLFTGLTNGVEYYFTVYSKNAMGTGLFGFTGWVTPDGSPPSISSLSVPAALQPPTPATVTAIFTDPSGLASGEITVDGGGTWYPMLPENYGSTTIYADTRIGRRATQVAVGYHHACARFADGTVDCWGANGKGQVGFDRAYAVSKTYPSPVRDTNGASYLSTTAAIATGYEHSCAVRTDGRVVCWGLNASGQLGNGSQTDADYAQLVQSVGGGGQLADATGIAAGYGHTCALLATTSVACWGANFAGQLGDGTTTDRLVPVLVSGTDGTGTLNGVVAVATGITANHTCALLAGGSVVCWGANGYDVGQLGSTPQSPWYSAVPLAVTGVGGSGRLTGVASITVGSLTSCARLVDGTVDCWGSNLNGELGIPVTTTSSSSPLPVSGTDGSGTLGSVTALTQGNGFACAVQSGGRTLCWGANGRGQLGTDSTIASAAPVVVHGIDGAAELTGASTVAAGGSLACGIQPTGSLVCWGWNYNGALGMGRSTGPQTCLGGPCSTTPVRLRGITGGLASGSVQVCVRATDIAGNRSGGATCSTIVVRAGGYTASGPTGGGLGSDSGAFTLVPDGPYSGTITVTTSGGGLSGSTAYVFGSADPTTFTIRPTTAGPVTVSFASGGPALPDPLPLTYRTPPGPPSITNMSATDGAVAVTWSAPAQNGGAEVTGYTVTAFPGGASCSWTTGPTTCTVEGLANATPYSFTVTPRNTFGAGVPSPSQSATPRTVPNAPGSVSAVGGNQQATISWSLPDSSGGSTITLYTASTSDGTRGCQWSIATGGPLACTVSGLTNGLTYRFFVRATNAAGSSAWSTASAFVTPAAPATVAALSVAKGNPGTTIPIGGTNFYSVSQVKFGSVQAAFVVLSPTSIVAAVPIGGSGTIKVVTPAGEATGATAFALTTGTTLPSVGSFTPTSGVAGTTVTVTGANFVGATAVKVGTATARSGWTITSATTFTIPVDATATTGTVAVTTPTGTGTSAASFTVLRRPDISSFTPALQIAGLPVTITGTNFASIGTVRFGDRSAATFTVVSATSITAIPPADLTAGAPVTLSVVNPAGTGTSVASFTRVRHSATLVAGGTSHACAIVTGGRIRCWGLNTSSQLGDASVVQRNLSVEATALTTAAGSVQAASVTAGGAFTCAALTDGTARCWGANASGQLGNGATATFTASAVAVRTSATDATSLRGVVQIAAATAHACALLGDGTVRCWGAGTFGQLGSGAVNSSSPVVVGGAATPLTGVVAIAAGGNATCALRSSGAVLCWGANDLGQLGSGTTNKVANPTPAQVSGMSAGSSAIAVGVGHACATASSDGSVKCWGVNGSRQLGDGTVTTRLVPVAVLTALNSRLTGAASLSAGNASTCAALTSGGMRCWGSDAAGQLGNAAAASPTYLATVLAFDGVTPIAGVTGIASGGTSTYALVGGRLAAWGANTNGQVGDNTVTGRTFPIATLGF